MALCLKASAFILLLALMPSTVVAGTPRTWNGANGKFKTTAELARYTGNTIVLRNEKGKTTTVPISKLCPADQAFLQMVQRSRFPITGVGEISATVEGYQWQHVRNGAIGNTKVSSYLCQSLKPGNVLLLTVTDQIAPSNDHRIAHIKGHFNGLLNGFEGLGVKATKHKHPQFAGETPHSQEYWIEGKGSSGEVMHALGLTAFLEKHTLVYQALGSDRSTLENLLTASETLTEEIRTTLPQQESNSPLDERSNRRTENYPIKIPIPREAQVLPEDLKVEKGTPLAACYGREWNPVTALRENEDGSIHIRWDEYSESWNCDMSRDQLIIQNKTIRELTKKTPTASEDLRETSRTWTDKSGKHKIEAKFVKRTETEVTLKTDAGREITLPISKLSEVDRELISGQEVESE